MRPQLILVGLIGLSWAKRHNLRRGDDTPSLYQPPQGSNYNYFGCIEDRGFPRSLPNFITIPNVTPAACATTCISKGYAYAGLEYGSECWCGNSIEVMVPAPESDCNLPCAGDPSLLCGGNYRLNLYKDPDNALSTVYVTQITTQTATQIVTEAFTPTWAHHPHTGYPSPPDWIKSCMASATAGTSMPSASGSSPWPHENKTCSASTETILSIITGPDQTVTLTVPASPPITLPGTIVTVTDSATTITSTLTQAISPFPPLENKTCSITTETMFNTITGPGQNATLTVPGPTVTLPGASVTITDMTTATSTVTLPRSNLTLTNPSATITTTLTQLPGNMTCSASTQTIFSTLTESGQSITLSAPATTVFSTITQPYHNMTAYHNTTACASASTVTLPGSITTITEPGQPGATVLSTITQPGGNMTVTAPGSTVTLPGETEMATTILETMTITQPGDRITITAPASTSTITLSGQIMTITEPATTIISTVTQPAPNTTVTTTIFGPSCPSKTQPPSYPECYKPGPDGKPNMLMNGGFECDLLNWKTKEETAKNFSIISTGGANSGNKFLMYGANSSNSSSIMSSKSAYLWQAVNGTRGGSYTASVYIADACGGKVQCKVQFKFEEKSGSKYSSAQIPIDQVDGGYKLYTFVYRPGDDFTGFGIGLACNGPPGIKVDDVSLVGSKKR